MTYKTLMVLSATGFLGLLGWWVLPLQAAALVLGTIMDRTAPRD